MELVHKEKYNIPIETQKFILQMCWAQHDGQWFLKSKKKHGIKEANYLNQQALYSMGKIEARYILSALGIKKGTVKTLSEVIKVMNTFMDVIVPKVMKFKFIINSEKEGSGIVEKCYIWKEVEKSKEANEYECACNFRHKGWIDALGINAKIVPVKRIPDGDDLCEFQVILE